MTRINEVLYFVLYDLCKIKRRRTSLHLSFALVRPSGIEPPHTAPENYEKKPVIQHSVKD